MNQHKKKKPAFRHFSVYCLITQNTSGVPIYTHTYILVVNHLFIGISPTDFIRCCGTAVSKNYESYMTSAAIVAPKDRQIDNGINAMLKRKYLRRHHRFNE